MAGQYRFSSHWLCCGEYGTIYLSAGRKWAAGLYIFSSCIICQPCVYKLLILFLFVTGGGGRVRTRRAMSHCWSKRSRSIAGWIFSRIFSRIKFMHSFHFKLLPLSFAETWISNVERNPGRMLRNAEDYYIPAHRVEFVKRLPLFSFPAAWNNAPGEKLNPRQHLYLKALKNHLISIL